MAKCQQIILPSQVVNFPSFRLGVDLDKIFKNGRHPLPASLAGTLAVQVINALEYLHSKGYTHNDIKVPWYSISS
jgi:serine/threonine protein kinase